MLIYSVYLKKLTLVIIRKGVYPYEYMDSWERFNETSLPDKDDFYSNLNMEDITDLTICMQKQYS